METKCPDLIPVQQLAQKRQGVLPSTRPRYYYLRHRSQRNTDRSAAKMAERYLEDFAVGQTFGSARLVVEEARIKTFAAEFDPQPFHLDAEAARHSLFGGLAASGWHTAALTMRLLVESDIKPVGGIVGAGFDEFRWPRPVRP